MYDLFVSCPKGLEYLLEEELKTWGLRVTRVSPQGVYGKANLTVVYQLCLWSRIANRVQIILFTGEVCQQQDLYQICVQYPWQTVFSVDKTFAVEFHGNSLQIRNTMFGAQVVKDGIVDYYRQTAAARPAIDKDAPQIRLHAYLKENIITVSLDLTGYSLHQRGYRLKAGAAPLKENVAAALLIRAKWPELAASGFSLQDPFCGVGTLVIEAAMIAANRAPGLIRRDQSFQHWAEHQNTLWERVREQALEQIKPISIKLQGTDVDASCIGWAKENAACAGVNDLISFERMELTESRPISTKGLVVCNPPYGERLDDVSKLVPLYQKLGQVLHQSYQDWQAAILTTDPLLAKATGLKASKSYTLYNGALAAKLYCFTLNETNRLKEASATTFSAGAQMLANRLEKNKTHLKKWLKRQHINCYRLYDADLPEYAFAIDVYGDYVVLQEYAAPATIAVHKVARRSLEVHQAVQHCLGVPAEYIILKQRQRQKGLNQYQKINQTQQNLLVQEGSAQFIVNLRDYLDTGLFLDHRLIRLSFAKLPPKTRFLNCFCYTATASVHAALGGALTTNVDLSNTYLTWAKENFKVNRLNLTQHQFIQADCLTWLKQTPDRFDVIFLDPPSFSNSKRMGQILDIQRDHESLIRTAMHLLYPGGILYFSTNLRSFKISASIKEYYKVRDITTTTIDIDFKRQQRIHQCFMITTDER